MLRRDKTEPAPAEQQPTKVGGKGRPTPSRKEAEAAAKAKAKVPRTRKEIAAAQRTARTESSSAVRAGLKAGDERYLRPRDKGPVKRFIRDFVDSRFSFIEVIIPMLLLTMVLSYSRQPTLMRIGTTVMFTTVFLVIVDIMILRFRMRRQLTARFPSEPMNGTTYYAVTRAMQLRFMRLPKTQVRIGQELPEHYR